MDTISIVTKGHPFHGTDLYTKGECLVLIATFLWSRINYTMVSDKLHGGLVLWKLYYTTVLRLKLQIVYI